MTILPTYDFQVLQKRSNKPQKWPYQTSKIPWSTQKWSNKPFNVYLPSLQLFQYQKFPLKAHYLHNFSRFWSNWTAKKSSGGLKNESIVLKFCMNFNNNCRNQVYHVSALISGRKCQLWLKISYFCIFQALKFMGLKFQFSKQMFIFDIVPDQYQNSRQKPNCTWF